MVLKVPGEELELNSNHVENLFAHKGNGSFVGVGRNLVLLMEFFHMKGHHFGVVGRRSSEVCNGLNDIIDGFFKFLSWLN